MFWISLPRYVAVILCDSIYRLCAPKSSMRQQEKKYFEQCGTNAIKRKEKICPVLPLEKSLTFLWLLPQECPNSIGALSDRKLIIVLQRIRQVFGRIAAESGMSHFLTNRKTFFRIYLIALTSPLRLEALHLTLVDVFGYILDPEFENDIHIFKEKFMEAMQSQDDTKSACGRPSCTGVPLGPTFEQALKS